MLQNPRDMREWMAVVERGIKQANSIPIQVSAALDVVQTTIDENTTRHPTAPVELTYQTALYVDPFNRRRARFLLDFPDVVKATDGTDIDVAQYELWGRETTQTIKESTVAAVPGLALPGASSAGLAFNDAVPAPRPFRLLSTSTDSSFRVDDFLQGSKWVFKARAMGAHSTVPGDFSIDLAVVMEQDATPPPQTTAPTAVASRGTITVTWDGQSVLGAMPADFSYAILAQGTAASPINEVARFGRGGGFTVVADIAYYEVQYFRLAAVDESGNVGPWSEQAVAYTTPLVDKDIILSTIDGAKTFLKNIDAGVAILPHSIITENLLVTEEMTAAIANFLHVTADHIDANSIWADEIWVGLADAKLVRSDMFIGKAFQGGTFTGGLFQSNVENYKGIKFDPTAILAYSASGVETFRLDAATGNLTASYGTLTGLKYQTDLAAATGIKIDKTTGIQSYNASGQLQFNITSAGATFTGTVTSGFGASKAKLSDAVYAGRPGISIVTGSSYYAEPFMVSYDASSSDAAYRGALYLSAAWTSGSSSPGRLLMSENGGWSLGGWNGSVSSQGGGVNGVQMQSAGGTVLAGPNSYMVAAGSAASMEVDASGAASIYSTTGTTIYNGLSVSGAKSFVMDHPMKQGMELLHGATESPVSGVEYWGCGTIGADGADMFHLPDYFHALVKDQNQCVAVYGNGAVVGWSAITDGAVTVTGPVGTKYSWLVKAERTGGDFPVERVKVQRPEPGVPAA